MQPSPTRTAMRTIAIAQHEYSIAAHADVIRELSGTGHKKAVDGRIRPTRSGRARPSLETSPDSLSTPLPPAPDHPARALDSGRVQQEGRAITGRQLAEQGVRVPLPPPSPDIMHMVENTLQCFSERVRQNSSALWKAPHSEGSSQIFETLSYHRLIESTRHVWRLWLVLPLFFFQRR